MRFTFLFLFMSLVHQPIRVNGRPVKGMRVHELVSALTAAGVPEASFPKDKAGKLSLLTSTVSAKRSKTGPLGTLEDGQSINDLSFDQAVAEVARRGGVVDALNPHEELRRVVCILTGQPCLVPQTPAAPPAPQPGVSPMVEGIYGPFGGSGKITDILPDDALLTSPFAPVTEYVLLPFTECVFPAEALPTRPQDSSAEDKLLSAHDEGTTSCARKRAKSKDRRGKERNNIKETTFPHSL